MGMDHVTDSNRAQCILREDACDFGYDGGRMSPFWMVPM